MAGTVRKTQRVHGGESDGGQFSLAYHPHFYPQRLAAGYREFRVDVTLERDATLIRLTSAMARSPFQLPMRPIDLFEDFVDRRGDLRSRQADVEFFEPRHSSRQNVPPIIAVVAWLICAAFCVGVAFLAWFIIDALTMYRL